MREPKLYLSRRQADQMLEAFPSLKGQDAIVVMDATPVPERHELLKRLNQKRPADDFKPNRKMRRKNLTLWKKSG